MLENRRRVISGSVVDLCREAYPAAVSGLTHLCRSNTDQRELTIERLLEPVRRKTKKQHRCRSQHERRLNVVRCYVVARPELVAGRNILIVGDVLTPGSTIRECQRMLLKAGALDVRGFVLGRTAGW